MWSGVSIVYSIVCSGGYQRKYQGSASLALYEGINRWPVNSPHKEPVTWKLFPFDDVIRGEASYICSIVPSALHYAIIIIILLNRRIIKTLEGLMYNWMIECLLYLWYLGVKDMRFSVMCQRFNPGSAPIKFIISWGSYNEFNKIRSIHNSSNCFWWSPLKKGNFWFAGCLL